MTRSYNLYMAKAKAQNTCKDRTTDYQRVYIRALTRRINWLCENVCVHRLQCLTTTNPTCASKSPVEPEPCYKALAKSDDII